MFRRSNNQPTKDIFKDYDRVYSNASYTEKLSDPSAWHNLFYENVYQKIDESIFSPCTAKTEWALPTPLLLYCFQ